MGAKQDPASMLPYLKSPYVEVSTEELSCTLLDTLVA